MRRRDRTQLCGWYIKQCVGVSVRRAVMDSSHHSNNRRQNIQIKRKGMQRTVRDEEFNVLVGLDGLLAVACLHVVDGEKNSDKQCQNPDSPRKQCAAAPNSTSDDWWHSSCFAPGG